MKLEELWHTVGALGGSILAFVVVSIAARPYVERWLRRQEADLERMRREAKVGSRSEENR